MLFLIPLPAVVLIAWKYSSNLVVNWVFALLLLRVLWLSLINPDWVTHLSNDGFIISLGLTIWIFILCQIYKSVDKHLFLNALFILGILQVLIGITQLYTHTPIPSIPIKTAFIGTIGTPNGLGLLIVLSLFCGIYMISNSSKKQIPILGSFFLFLGLLLSESRGSILVLFAVVGFVVILKLVGKSSKKSKIVLSLLISGVLGILIPTLYLMDVESSSGRFILWEISWMMFKDHIWFGVGQGNYALEFLNYQAEYLSLQEHADLAYKASNVKQAHNEYLQAFATSGALGGVLFMSIWILPLYWMVKNEWKDLKKISTHTINMAIHLAIVLHSFIDSPLHVFPIVLIGYTNLIISSDSILNLRIQKVYHRLGFIILTMLTLYIGYHSFSKYSGQYHWRKGVEQIDAKNWEASIYHLSNALDYLPDKGELMYQLGASYIFNEQYARGFYLTNESKKYFNDKNIFLTESYGHIQLGEYQEAEKSALTALSMFPTQIAPHLLLGEIYYYQNRIEESKKSLEKCISEDTPIKSADTNKISNEAKKLYSIFYD